MSIVNTFCYELEYYPELSAFSSTSLRLEFSLLRIANRKLISGSNTNHDCARVLFNCSHSKTDFGGFPTCTIAYSLFDLAFRRYETNSAPASRKYSAQSVLKAFHVCGLRPFGDAPTPYTWYPARAILSLERPSKA